MPYNSANVTKILTLMGFGVNMFSCNVAPPYGYSKTGDMTYFNSEPIKLTLQGRLVTYQSMGEQKKISVTGELMKKIFFLPPCSTGGGEFKCTHSGLSLPYLAVAVQHQRLQVAF